MGSVGEPEGYVDNYWRYSYSPNDPYALTPNEGLVQVKKNNKNYDDRIYRPYDRAEGYGFGITNAFVLANSGPDDGNSSKIVKFVASSLIFMFLSPYSLFAVSQIYDNVIRYSYDNETKEYTIELPYYNVTEWYYIEKI